MAAVKIEESIDIESMMERIPIEMRSKAQRLAVKRGGGEVARAYKKRVPKGKTGNLKRSIPSPGQVKVVSYQGERVWVAVVGARFPMGSHAHLVDGGHDVFARGPKGKSAKGKNKPTLTGSPRVEGKRDLLKAVMGSSLKVNKVIIDTLIDAIKKAENPPSHWRESKA